MKTMVVHLDVKVEIAVPEHRDLAEVFAEFVENLDYTVTSRDFPVLDTEIVDQRFSVRD